jgi:hypothetical protein
MGNMVPVSDMRYFNHTLSDVSQGSQVTLTKNGMAKICSSRFSSIRPY